MEIEELKKISTYVLENELKQRKDRNLGRCPTCGGTWTLYMGCSRSWQEEPHCFGCRKPVADCTCR